MIIDPLRNNDSHTRGDDPSNLAETAEGELIFSADGDLMIATASEALIQKSVYVVNTKKYSSSLFPGLGTRIREVMGHILTPEYLNEIEAGFYKELIENGVIPVEGSYEVNPLDVVGSRLLITFALENPSGGYLHFNYSFDVDSGAIEQIGGNQL